MPTVFITPEVMRDRDAPYARLLREAGFEVRYPQRVLYGPGAVGADDMIEELRGADAVIASAEHYTPRVLDALPSLRVVARAGVGYDAVDVPACTGRNVVVTITPTSNHAAVAELALALLFAVAKSMVAGDRALRAGRWPRESTMPIRGKTLGILGLGRIGRSMATRSQSLGMTVIATEQFPDQKFIAEHGIELVDFPTLLARSDIVSLHCPLTDETRGIMNADAFARMKPGSVFLNTARGKLVVEKDLVAALRSGHLRGAGLDVFEEEPPSRDNPLFALDNVVVSPHIAGCDEMSLVGMGVEAAQCIVKLSRGEWPEGAVVNAELKGRWKW
jgi:phosphoglycerate dehydrogenase-like enzyme